MLLIWSLLILCSISPRQLWHSSGITWIFFSLWQVPLLLSIDEEDTALAKATESGDTDLIYLVLFHIWPKVTPQIKFFSASKPCSNPKR